MSKRITILLAHPDPAGGHFAHALADAYAGGARTAGHEVRLIDIAQLTFPILRCAEDLYQGEAPEAVRAAQEALHWADHLLIVHPLWFGHFPALLHAFLEQIFRPGFIFGGEEPARPRRLLRGKSARIVVTMGMPAFVYRWLYHARGVKSLKTHILGFAGFRPVNVTLIGRLGSGAAGTRFDRQFPATLDPAARRRWLDELQSLGKAGV